MTSSRMDRLRFDVRSIVESMGEAGLTVTEAAVLDQLKVKNKEYVRKPAVRAVGLYQPPLLRFQSCWHDGEQSAQQATNTCCAQVTASLL